MSGLLKRMLLCLLAVDLYAVIYYWAAYGAQYGLRVILLTLAACVSALATDAVYYKVLKKDVIKEVRSSFSLITALIIVLISRINTAYYAIVIATIIAIFFGKLVFGGFGLFFSFAFAGLIWCITIIGIPFGKQCFKLAKLAAFPFGATVS